ncbi:MAG: UDP-N-acetylmuramoyl-tripeptide--D-alanyl-D-alanine ligase [Candidatus Omnitrophica bacterium]|nr:UDP-N-acetylmuramoyl-tripeptide--D-alanyl-D-alanine ligase [Candidatus Omnitrophota bacterium]
MFTVSEIAQVLKNRKYKDDRTKIKGVCIDSRKVKKGDLYIAIKGERFNGNDFVLEAYKKGAVCIIASKNTKDAVAVEKHIPVFFVKDTIKNMGDIACFYRCKMDIPIVAITGSAGKTSTKEIIAFLLSKSYKVLKTEGTKNNFIGVPLTLFQLKKTHEVGVVELGTNSPGEISRLSQIVQPDVGVITNVGDAHLKGFKTRLNVLKEKKELINSLPDNGIAVLNGDDQLLNKIKVHCKKVMFNIDKKSHNDKYYDKKGALSFYVGSVKFTVSLIGKHNLYNVLCAVTVGQIFDIPLKKMALSLKKYRAENKNRFFVSRKGRYTVIDDTYNSNPLSMQKAIESLDKIGKNKKIIIVSDMLELGEQSKKLHIQIGKNIASAKIDKLITVGKEAAYIANGAIKNGMEKAHVFVFNEKESLYKQLFNILEPNDIILVKGSRKAKMEEVVRKIELMKSSLQPSAVSSQPEEDPK